MKAFYIQRKQLKNQKFFALFSVRVRNTLSTKLYLFKIFFHL